MKDFIEKKTPGLQGKSEAARYMSETHKLSISRGCHCVVPSCTDFYAGSADRMKYDESVIDALNGLVEGFPRQGFSKYVDILSQRGSPWNHERIYLVYCDMGLNQPRHTKWRLPERDPMPLVVPQRPDQVWLADFMSDVQHGGRRFRVFNVIDDYDREARVVEVGTLLRSRRLVRLFERLKETMGLPDIQRVDSGLEFLGTVFTGWCRERGISELGKPNQNAFIERFNRSVGNEVLDLYLFRNLDRVQPLIEQWRTQYNEQGPHSVLGGPPPRVYAERNPEKLQFETVNLTGRLATSPYRLNGEPEMGTWYLR